MSCIQTLLSNLCSEVEQALKPHLQGLEGLIVSTQLPQIWNFKTEKESVIFYIDKQGNASVVSGSAPVSDVTISWKHDYLASVLRNRSAKEIPKGEIIGYEIHTFKGQQGFNILRQQIGI